MSILFWYDSCGVPLAGFFLERDTKPMHESHSRNTTQILDVVPPPPPTNLKTVPTPGAQATADVTFNQHCNATLCNGKRPRMYAPKSAYNASVGAREGVCTQRTGNARHLELFKFLHA